MTESWISEEPGLLDGIRQARRLLVRGARRRVATAVGSLLAALSAVALVALLAGDFAPRYVLRVVEMGADPDVMVQPQRQLQQYVRTAVFTSGALEEVIARHGLYPSLFERNRRAAVESFREDVEVEVYQNYFLEERTALEAPRSARLAVRFRHSDRKVALAVTRDLGELIVAHERAARRASADRAATTAREARQRASRNLTRHRAAIVDKRIQIQRGGSDDALLQVELVSLLGSLPVQEREVERAERRASRLELAAALEHHEAGIGFQVVDDGSVPKSEELSRLELTAVFVASLFAFLPFVAALVGAHSEDGGVA